MNVERTTFKYSVQPNSSSNGGRGSSNGIGSLCSNDSSSSTSTGSSSRGRSINSSSNGFFGRINSSSSSSINSNIVLIEIRHSSGSS